MVVSLPVKRTVQEVFTISAEGEPGDLAELTAQRGQARSEAAHSVSRRLRRIAEWRSTMLAQDWQLSGRARLGEPGTTMTWTLTSMDPQRAVAAQLLLNGAPGLVPWRRRAGETLAVTHAPPVTSMFSNHTEPLNLGRGAWIGPVGETSLLLLDLEAIPFQNPSIPCNQVWGLVPNGAGDSLSWLQATAVVDCS